MCKQKGLSNYALAKKSHVSTSTIHSILSGKTRPQIYTLLQICNALEVSVDEMFGDEVTADKDSLKGVENDKLCEKQEKEGCICGLSESEMEMILHYRKLPDEKKEETHG